MKQFLIVIVAATIAVVIGLVIYDRVVVERRLQRERDVAAVSLAALKVEAETLREATRKNIRDAKSEAQSVAAEFDQSIQASLNSARTQVASTSQEYSRRALLYSAIASAAMFKVAVTEFYFSEGRLPFSNSQIGMSEPSSYANEALRAISVGSGGVVTLHLNEKLAAPAKTAEVNLQPVPSKDGRLDKWQCSSNAGRDIQTMLSACK
jgi:type IV pilus assembly protein PilA